MLAHEKSAVQAKINGKLAKRMPQNAGEHNLTPKSTTALPSPDAEKVTIRCD
jgi:hypothetical protein